MIDSALTSMAQAIQSYPFIAPLIALVAGALTSITPCSLSSIPLVIGYVGNATDDPKKAFRFSLVFALGTAITFTVLGTVASMLGTFISQAGAWWYIVLGVLMVLMALQTWDVINFIPSTNLISKNTKKGYIGALLSGILGGIFSSPCATPVLIALLAVLTTSDNLLYGILLLLCYSVGHGVLTVISGTSMGFVKKLRKGKATLVAKTILGILILAVGLYMFYLGF